MRENSEVVRIHPETLLDLFSRTRNIILGYLRVVSSLNVEVENHPDNSAVQVLKACEGIVLEINGNQQNQTLHPLVHLRDTALSR